MNILEGKVALVTGGTKNLGKGIALSLGEAGATVYVTGRNIKDKDIKEIIDVGGKAFAISCNHENDAEVESVFELIMKNEGKLDILVNNAWGGYERLRNRKANPDFKWKDPFWKQPLDLWEDMNTVGVRSNYIASVFATRLMLENKKGLIVNISFYASKKYYGNVIYGVSKASVDKMTMDMSVELKKSNIACVSLYPGYIADKKKKTNPKKESSQFSGRAIVALAADDKIMKKSGQILVSAELAKEYGFKDIDNTQPEPYDTL